MKNMERREIVSENTLKDPLEYIQNDIKEEPLDIKVESEDFHNNSTGNDVVDTGETSSKIICLNLDYLKVASFKVETTVDSQTLQNSSEYEPLDINFTVKNDINVDFVKSDKEETILPSNSDTKNKQNTLYNDECSKSEKNRGKKFRCSICGYIAKSYTKLKAHEAVHSDEKLYQCLKCNYSSKFSFGLSRHIRNNHGDGKGFIFKKKSVTIQKENSSSIVIQNSQVLQKSSEIDALEPNVTFNNNFDVENMKNEKFYEILPTDAGRNRTLKKLHKNKVKIRNKNEKLFSCSICGYTTKVFSRSKQHEAVHSDNRPYTCLKCNFSFKYHHNLTDHMKKCSGKPRKTRCIRKNHEESLLKKKKHVTIPKVSSPSVVLQNSQVLQKSNEIDALEPNVTFINNFDVETLKNDKFEEIFPRDPGRNRMVKKLHKNKQIKMKNTNKKLFSCSVCGYTAKCLSRLKIHEAVHSDERPYPCLKCNFNFKYRNNLTKHMKKCSSKPPKTNHLRKNHGKGKVSHLKNIKHATTPEMNSPLVILKKLQLSQNSIEIDAFEPNVTFNNNFDGETVQNQKFEEILTSDAGRNGTLEKFRKNEQIKIEKQNEKTFSCSICDYKTKFFSTLKRHEDVHFVGKPYKCSKCDYATKLIHRLTLHEKNCHGKGKGSQRKKKKQVYTQKKVTTSVVLPNPQVLGKSSEFDSVNSNGTLNKFNVDTVKSDRDKKILLSNSCEKRKGNSLNTNECIESVKIDGTKFQCSICGYFARCYSILKTHEAVHSIEKPYQCSKCDYSSKFPFNLYSHIRKNHGEEKGSLLKKKDVTRQKESFLSVVLQNSQVLQKSNEINALEPSVTFNSDFDVEPMENEKFDETLPSKSNEIDALEPSVTFKNDFDVETMENEYFEEILPSNDGRNKAFKKLHKNKPVIKNKKEKMFLCSICGYTTKFFSRLKCHKASHSDERPYTCLKCNFSFKYRGNLTVHRKKCNSRRRRSHSNLEKNRGKKFPCSLCKYVASSYRILIIHEAVHSDEKPYQCSKCDYSSKFSSNLSNHKKKYHGEGKKSPLKKKDVTIQKGSFPSVALQNSQVLLQSDKIDSLEPSVTLNNDFDVETLKNDISEEISPSDTGRNRLIKKLNNIKHDDKKFEKEVNETLERNERNSRKESKSISINLNSFGKDSEEIIKELGNSHSANDLNVAFEYSTQTPCEVNCRQALHTNCKCYISSECNFGTERKINYIQQKRKKCCEMNKHKKYEGKITESTGSDGKCNFSESHESHDNIVSSKPSYVSVRSTFQNNNNAKSNEDSTEGVICSNTKSHDINPDANQSNDIDNDAELFKFFPADSEGIYGDDALIQIFFQKPKVLLEKLKLHFCTKCDFVSESSSKLNTHKYETHLRSKKYQCSDCSYTSVKWWDLKRHENTHKKNVCEENISSRSEIITNDKISWSNNGNETNVNDAETNYEFLKYNEKSNINVGNVDLNHFLKSIFQFVNSNITPILTDIFSIDQNLLIKKTSESVVKVLKSDQDIKDKMLERKYSQSNNNDNKPVDKTSYENLSKAIELWKESQSKKRVNKPVDKTSHEYLIKAIELYKETLSDSEDEVDSSDENVITEKNNSHYSLERNENISQESLLEYANVLNKNKNEEEVDKTSYEYLSKAVELYKKLLS